VNLDVGISAEESAPDETAADGSVGDEAEDEAVTAAQGESAAAEDDDGGSGSASLAIIGVVAGLAVLAGVALGMGRRSAA
jgi:hypothetical protein